MGNRIEEYELKEISVVITQELINRYAEVSGDHNLIHLDSEFAKSSMFGHIIAHGMLTLSLIDQMMDRKFGNVWHATGVTKCRFRGAAAINDHITGTGVLNKSEELDEHLRLIYNVTVRNTDTNETLIGGTCTIDVPKP